MLSDFIDSDIIHSDRRPQQNNGQRIYSFTENFDTAIIKNEMNYDPGNHTFRFFLFF